MFKLAIYSNSVSLKRAVVNESFYDSLMFLSSFKFDLLWMLAYFQAYKKDNGVYDISPTTWIRFPGGLD